MAGLKRVVILGGGFAGLRVLAGLRDLTGIERVLVDARVTSLVKPALPEVSLAGKSVEDVRIPLEPAVRSAGGEFMHQWVERVVPSEHRVDLGDGEDLDYDYLVVATGAL
jgi:sulfide:quinone oxidoreductase